MRITGGQARGRRISAPDGLEVRPTASKVRQAFFNILGFQIKGCRFLDLFAGSGLMGLEALSRGASTLVVVEEQRKMVRAINDNMSALEFQAEVICADVRKILPTLAAQSFDVIFADPPYKSSLAGVVVEQVAKHDLLAPGGVLVVEHLKNTAMPQSAGALRLSDQRFYGQTTLSFFRSEHNDQPERASS